eukprot:2580729-Alexandrium_andersonii.AAC.1
MAHRLCRPHGVLGHDRRGVGSLWASHGRGGNQDGRDGGCHQAPPTGMGPGRPQRPAPSPW